MQGNTCLHYASAWGHVSIVQTLIERGCGFAARNNEGFEAVDYAYSNATMEVLTESGRLQIERSRQTRKNARQRARDDARAGQGSTSIKQSATSGEPRELPPAIPPKSVISSSSTSALLDSQPKPHIPPARPTLQTAFLRPSAEKASPRKKEPKRSIVPAGPLPALPAGSSALTPVASRVREKDADAIAHFMDAFRSTGVTAPKSAIVDPGRPILRPDPGYSNGNGSNNNPGLTGARAAIHKLKQSVSLSQIRVNASTSSSSQHSASASIQSDMQNFDSSEYALTPKASMVHSPLHTHRESKDSITPPATRRSPFALLSRTTSHQDS